MKIQPVITVCDCLGCTGVPQKVADAWYTYLKAREAYEAMKVLRFPIERTRARGEL